MSPVVKNVADSKALAMNRENEDLPSKLRDWLQTEGYPFEMRVAQAFARAGFAIQQSDYYHDPEKGVPREVDVVASVKSSVRFDLIFRIIFLIECKSSLDKPWLLFCTPGDDLPKPAKITQRISSKAALRVQMGLAQDKNVQNLALFNFRAPVGYGLKQAFAKDKDIAYSAMFSVGSAAEARGLLWTNHPHEPHIVELIFPVIAIEGRLFKCWLDEADVVSVNEITAGTLLWSKGSGHRGHTIIDVQTRSSIEDFATESHESARTLLVDYYEKALKILDKVRNVRRS
jgi:hypothetical protein